MATIPSQQTLSTGYQNKVAALNPNLNPYRVGGEFWMKSQIQGGMLSGAYADSYAKSLNIWPQNQISTYVDKSLASWCLAQRQGAFAATGEMRLTSFPTAEVTIDAGTIVAYSADNSYAYTTTESVTVPNDPDTYATYYIPIESNSIGSGTSLASGTPLTPVSPITNVATFTIVDMVDGSPAETDPQCITRILNRIQYPPAGGSEGDYILWAESVTNVTGAFVRGDLLSLGIVGVYILSGGSDFDTILQYPDTPYSRTASTTTIAATSAYIETVRPITDSYQVLTVSTYIIPSDVINVAVEYASGITDSTPIVTSTGTLTARNLVLREIRRAVLNTPPGGNLVEGVPYLFASDISDALGLGLSAKSGLTGLYATILNDWHVTLLGAGGIANPNAPNFELPSTVDSNQEYPYVYDIDYDFVQVTNLST